MRLRFWLGLTAVFLIAAGSVLAAVLVYVDDDADFHQMQREQAARSARQAEAVVALSVGQLGSVAAFFQAQEDFTQHQYDVIARPLLEEGDLSGTAFIERVPAAERAAFERRSGAPIFERTRGGPRPALERRTYYPIAYAVSAFGTAAPIGYDMFADPGRGPFLRVARDSGEPVATPPVPLILGGVGINVYRPVYRDGAPIRTVAQRRSALIGFAAGAFRVRDLLDAAVTSVPDPVDVQIRAGSEIFGEDVELDDAARSPVEIADQTWVLIVNDPGDPTLVRPLLLAVIGIALSALLGSLIIVWSRNERIEELQREANEDPLTGLKNRRRFDEELRAAMARGRREGTTGAVLMIDLDEFKSVNDSRGHAAGDQLIAEVAEVLRRRVRESDVLARLGGDEFAVVLPRCSRGEALVVAEAIAAAIRDHRFAGGDMGPTTASVGVAMFGEDPRLSPASVVSEADTAMYAAKDGGRDGVRFFDPTAVAEEARRPD